MEPLLDGPDPLSRFIDKSYHDHQTRGLQDALPRYARAITTRKCSPLWREVECPLPLPRREPSSDARMHMRVHSKRQNQNRGSGTAIQRFTSGICAVLYQGTHMSIVQISIITPRQSLCMGRGAGGMSAHSQEHRHRRNGNAPPFKRAGTQRFH